MKKLELKQGFTIIEVILVLALTLLLFSIMMLTVNSSVERQRYEDSVESFKSFLQHQYNQVRNVELDERSDDKIIGACKGDFGSTAQLRRRGRSNCYVVGRLLHLSNEVKNNEPVAKVDVLQIVYVAGSDNTSATDALKYNDYFLTDADIDRFQTAGVKVDEYTLPWDDAIARTSGDNVRKSSIFIFRSPASGTIRTYIQEGDQIAVDQVARMMTPTNLKNNYDICVVPKSHPRGPKRAVRVNAGASGASGIELMPPSEVKCQ